MAQNRAETCYLKININFVLYVTDLGKHILEITKFSI